MIHDVQRELYANNVEHETLDGLCFRGEQPARQVVRLLTANVLDSSILNACTSLTIDHRTQIEKLTSAFQSLYGGQFTLSTPLINQIFVYHSPTDAAPQFLQKLIPFPHL